MHIHAVADYAPPGYKLAQTLYEGGETVHRFVGEGLPDLECRGAWATPADELGALEAFRAEYGLPRAVVWEPRSSPAEELIGVDIGDPRGDATVIAEVDGGFVVEVDTLPPPKPKGKR